MEVGRQIWKRQSVKFGKFSEVKIIVCGHVENVVTRFWHVLSNTSHAKLDTFCEKITRMDLEPVVDNVPRF